MYIGIDIGATNIRVAAFSGKRAEKLKEVEIFKVTPDFESSIKNIVNSIDSISGGQKIEGIGVVTAGVIDGQKKLINKSSNLPLWENKPLGLLLEKHFKTEIILENDAVAPAVCESLYGQAVNSDKFLYFIWGTGVGGSYVEKADNKITIHTMEPGHQIIKWNGSACGCKQNGCLEAYIGGRSLEKKYGAKFYEVLSNAEWSKVCSYATHGIINTLMHFPVNLIIFGGGVILNNPKLLSIMELQLTKYQRIYPQPRLKILKFKDKSSLYGAAGLFFVNR